LSQRLSSPFLPLTFIFFFSNFFHLSLSQLHSPYFLPATFNFLFVNSFIFLSHTFHLSFCHSAWNRLSLLQKYSFSYRLQLNNYVSNRNSFCNNNTIWLITTRCCTSSVSLQKYLSDTPVQMAAVCESDR
jgi:hypothetical protein